MSRSDSRTRRTRRRPRRAPIARICPGCGENVAHAPLRTPVWLDQPVRTCPSCGLGVAEPRGRRLDPRRRTLGIGVALTRMVATGLLLVGGSVLCATIARFLAWSFSRNEGTPPTIAGLAAVIVVSGLLVGLSMHRHGLRTGGLLATGSLIAWLWLAAAQPDWPTIPTRLHLASILLVMLTALVAAPAWHLLGLLLGRLGPTFVRRTT